MNLFCNSCFEKCRFKNACVECGRHGLADGLYKCLPCEKIERPWTRLSTSLLYHGGVKTWIHDMKENSKPERLYELSPEMLPLFDRVDFIIPVSSDPKHFRRRGYNTASLLAKYLSRLIQIPVLDFLFERSTFLSAQKELDEVRRRYYLKRILSLRPGFESRISSKKILLVDDVMTTGASLYTHAQLLKASGADINAYCIARTPKFLGRIEVENLSIQDD